MIRASQPTQPDPTLTPNGDLLGLSAGQMGVITGLIGNEDIRRRLMEMGFIPGSPIRFVMPTPFGDPLVYSLRGTSLALRRTEARCVQIRR